MKIEQALHNYISISWPNISSIFVQFLPVILAGPREQVQEITEVLNTSSACFELEKKRMKAMQNLCRARQDEHQRKQRLNTDGLCTEFITFAG